MLGVAVQGDKKTGRGSRLRKGGVLNADVGRGVALEAYARGKFKLSAAGFAFRMGFCTAMGSLRQAWPSPHNLSTVTSQSLHSHFTVTSQSLHSHFMRKPTQDANQRPEEEQII